MQMKEHIIILLFYYSVILLFCYSVILLFYLVYVNSTVLFFKKFKNVPLHRC